MNRDNFPSFYRPSLSDSLRFQGHSPNQPYFNTEYDNVSPNQKLTPPGFPTNRHRFSPRDQLNSSQWHSPNNPNFTSPPSVNRSPYSNGPYVRCGYRPYQNRANTSPGPRFNQPPHNLMRKSFSKNSDFDRRNSNPGGYDNIEMYYKSDMTKDPWQNLSPVPVPDSH